MCKLLIIIALLIPTQAGAYCIADPSADDAQCKQLKRMESIENEQRRLREEQDRLRDETEQLRMRELRQHWRDLTGPHASIKSLIEADHDASSRNPG